jgi:hypothetical protein
MLVRLPIDNPARAGGARPADNVWLFDFWVSGGVFLEWSTWEGGREGGPDCSEEVSPSWSGWW